METRYTYSNNLHVKTAKGSASIRSKDCQGASVSSKQSPDSATFGGALWKLPACDWDFRPVRGVGGWQGLTISGLWVEVFPVCAWSRMTSPYGSLHAINFRNETNE